MALEDIDDKNYKSAVDFRERIRRNQTSFRALYVSNYIVDETLTLLKDRCGAEVAISFGRALETSSAVRVLWIDSEQEASAWKIFQTHKDKDYSFTDCTSFALMKNNAIRNAFAYDRHFKQHGFNTLP